MKVSPKKLIVCKFGITLHPNKVYDAEMIGKLLLSETTEALNRIFEWYDLKDGHLDTHYTRQVSKKMEVCRAALIKAQQYLAHVSALPTKE